MACWFQIQSINFESAATFVVLIYELGCKMSVHLWFASLLIWQYWSWNRKINEHLSWWWMVFDGCWLYWNVCVKQTFYQEYVEKLGQLPTIARLSMNLLKLFKIYCALCECFKEVLLLIEHSLPSPQRNNTSAPFANPVFGHIRTMPFWSQRKHSKKNDTDQLIHLNVATNESGPVASSCAKCGHLIPALMEDLQ